jgi:hypothetical protein
LKIPPILPFTKGGEGGFPLWKRGIKGDFTVILLISWVLKFIFSNGKVLRKIKYHLLYPSFHHSILPLFHSSIIPIFFALLFIEPPVFRSPSEPGEP